MKIRIPDKLTEKFVPDLESINLLEYFLISAVTSLLLIRVFLTITGFPQLGGGGIHIAHMLWGGLLMLVAIIFFASFINSQSKVIASILGGVGFGTFIDELGKFITSDNDYFFQPTIAILYVVFVCFFLFIRWLASITQYSPKTYLTNAIESLKELVIFDLDSQEKDKSLTYLKKCNKNDPIVKMLTQIIPIAQAGKTKISLYRNISHRLLGWYRRALNVKFISKSLIGFFILSSGINLFSSIISLIKHSGKSFSDTGLFISSIAVGLLVMFSIRFYYKKDILNSYLFLHKASLVTIFITQFFLFLQNQLAGIVSLVVFISVYLVLKFAIEAEKKLHP